MIISVAHSVNILSVITMAANEAYMVVEYFLLAENWWS